jgi:mono/diheme cytochrome c family protein
VLPSATKGPASAVALAALAIFAAGCGSDGSSATGENPGDGKQIFTDSGCADCHEFAPAGSGSGSGPGLNGTTLGASEIAAQVRDGGGGMPSFSGDLTEQQIQAVSEFVAGD